jgi:magnesium chelatase family protein
MDNADIRKHCQLDEATQLLAKQALQRLNLSARGYMRLLKVARTIADLEASNGIQTHHVTEALQYRAAV